MAKIDELKEEARKLLREGKVKYVIGYATGSDGWSAVPAFIKTPEEVDRLIWDPTCVHNLTKFLVDEKRRKGRSRKPDTRPVGLFVKGCDSRAVVVLLQEKFIDRGDVYLLGVSCEKAGVIDDRKLAKRLKGRKPEKVELGRQRTVRHLDRRGRGRGPGRGAPGRPLPRVQGQFSGLVRRYGRETRSSGRSRNRTAPWKRSRSCRPEDRFKFWREQLDKCIRCYACRSVCPMCYCDECVVDSINLAVTADTSAEEKAQRIKWLQRSAESSENFVYHFVRAIHLAGRCIDCGECERVCPLDIPLRFLNKKLEKEARELFGYDAGFDADLPALIACFRDEDPQDFIR